jgi:hypothetical protein
MHRTGAHQFEQTADGIGQTGRDTGEDDDRDAVAQATLGNLLPATSGTSCR